MKPSASTSGRGVAAGRVIDHGDVRLDAPLLDQPSKVGPVAVTAITNQPLGPQTEAVMSTLDHPALCSHLGLTDRGRRLDADDHRMIEVDQIVGAVSKVRAVAMRRRPARRRIDG